MSVWNPRLHPRSVINGRFIPNLSGSSLTDREALSLRKRSLDRRGHTNVKPKLTRASGSRRAMKPGPGSRKMSKGFVKARPTRAMKLGSFGPKGSKPKRATKRSFHGKAKRVSAPKSRKARGATTTRRRRRRRR